MQIKELKPFKPSMLTNKFAAMIPKDITEAMNLAKILSESDLVPKEFYKKPANCLLAIGMGAEVGLSPFQALQNIMVVNGRPSMWGDAVLALVRASGKLEYIKETFDKTIKTAICVVKRFNEPELTRTFSEADATTAILINKPGPWQQYRGRMLQMRARSWALRDAFNDVLKGLQITEEAVDMVSIEADLVEAPKRVEAPPAAEPPSPPAEIEFAAAPASEVKGAVIAPEERKHLIALCQEFKIPLKELGEHLQKVYGITDDKQPTSRIHKSDYAAICGWIENGGQESLAI